MEVNDDSDVSTDWDQSSADEEEEEKVSCLVMIEELVKGLEINWLQYTLYYNLTRLQVYFVRSITGRFCCCLFVCVCVPNYATMYSIIDLFYLL